MPTFQQNLAQIAAVEKKGFTAATVELCTSHLRQFPTEPFAHLWYAITQKRLGNYSIAEKAVHRALSLRKESRFRGAAYQELGSIFENMGNHDKALTWYKRASRVNPGFDYNIFIGHSYFKMGLLEAAETYYRKSIRHPKSCRDEAYFNLGGLSLARRNYPKAIVYYRKAIELDPKYPEAKKLLRDAKFALRLKKSLSNP